MADSKLTNDISVRNLQRLLEYKHCGTLYRHVEKKGILRPEKWILHFVIISKGKAAGAWNLCFFENQFAKKADMIYSMIEFESIKEYTRENGDIIGFIIKFEEPTSSPLIFACDSDESRGIWVMQIHVAIQEAHNFSADSGFASGGSINSGRLQVECTDRQSIKYCTIDAIDETLYTDSSNSPVEERNTQQHVKPPATRTDTKLTESSWKDDVPMGNPNVEKHESKCEDEGNETAEQTHMTDTELYPVQETEDIALGRQELNSMEETIVKTRFNQESLQSVSKASSSKKENTKTKQTNGALAGTTINVDPHYENIYDKEKTINETKEKKGIERCKEEDNPSTREAETDNYVAHRFREEWNIHPETATDTRPMKSNYRGQSKRYACMFEEVQMAYPNVEKHKSNGKNEGNKTSEQTHVITKDSYSVQETEDIALGSDLAKRKQHEINSMEVTTVKTRFNQELLQNVSNTSSSGEKNTKVKQTNGALDPGLESQRGEETQSEPFDTDITIRKTVRDNDSDNSMLSDTIDDGCYENVNFDGNTAKGSHTSAPTVTSSIDSIRDGALHSASESLLSVREGSMSFTPSESFVSVRCGSACNATDKRTSISSTDSSGSDKSSNTPYETPDCEFIHSAHAKIFKREEYFCDKPGNLKGIRRYNSLLGKKQDGTYVVCPGESTSFELGVKTSIGVKLYRIHEQDEKMSLFKDFSRAVYVFTTVDALLNYYHRENLPSEQFTTKLERGYNSTDAERK